MASPTDASETLVHAVLAAQVAELRNRVDTGATLELLWRSSDVLAQLSGLVEELAGRCQNADAELHGRCDAAVEAEVSLRQALETLAFEQAQRNDFIAQTIDCVVTALGRLAAADVRESPALSPHDLAALYVSEDQRRVHQAVVRRFSLAGPSDRDGLESRDRERRGK